MANFETMTQEEIAAYFYDAQKTTIGDTSEYAGDAGRLKFIEDYASAFETWSTPTADAKKKGVPITQEAFEAKESSEKVMLDLQTEDLALKGDIAAGNLADWKAMQSERVETEAKWWEETADDDFTSEAELIREHNTETTALDEDVRRTEVQDLVTSYETTRDTALLQASQKGVRNPDVLRGLKETLWSSVAKVKDKYSDNKEKRHHEFNRTITDKKRHAIKNIEKIESETATKQSKLLQLGETVEMNNAFNKEEALNSYGGRLWGVMRRIMNTGIFDPEVKDVEPVPSPTNNYYSLVGDNNPSLLCVVSTTLEVTGAWSPSQKKDAVQWCKDTHHDGTTRGKTWITGYHIWGKFLSKWVKRSSIVRYIVDVTTDAFIDVTRRNKVNYLGYIIHYGWINPLSYIIGIVQKRKVLSIIIIPMVIAIYTILFPLFGIISIPYMVKRRRING